MAREHKFMVYDTEGKVICEVISLNRSIGSDWHEATVYLDGKYYVRPMRKLKLMQYTELKDKNKAEIYEGYICFDGTHYAVVIFQDGCFYLKYSFGMGYLFREIKNIEVVGSIWTTPELLND